MRRGCLIDGLDPSNDSFGDFDGTLAVENDSETSRR
jgi:hypothetical protein